MSASPAQLICARESTLETKVAEEGDDAELVREIFAALAEARREFPELSQLDAAQAAAPEVIDINSDDEISDSESDFGNHEEELNAEERAEVDRIVDGAEDSLIEQNAEVENMTDEQRA